MPHIRDPRYGVIASGPHAVGRTRTDQVDAALFGFRE
ncbi:hypothetical protein J2853_005489 [Streptosporangium lutulentum]|uniref:Uncharacterized protein n=1 Tax=Streptosporangium lutulentum TaxID=1461250 RepID=A0ABT9QHQ5_9ACTN|nr:hypothetical protein [Streptosporangium lutulentum]